MWLLPGLRNDLLRSKSSLNIITKRLPSKHDLFYTFTTCVFAVYMWSILIILYRVRAWILSMRAWDLIGAFSYTLAFALFESVIIFMFLMVMTMLLPAHLFREKFVSLSAVIIFLTSAWALFAHLFLDDALSLWGANAYIFLLSLYVVTLVIIYFLVLRHERINKFFMYITDRISVLSIMYISLGILGSLIIIIRNI